VRPWGKRQRPTNDTYGDRLDDARQLVTALIQQRNELAEDLAAVAKELGDSRVVSVSALTDLSDSHVAAREGERVVRQAAEVAERNRVTTQTLARCSDVVGSWLGDAGKPTAGTANGDSAEIDLAEFERQAVALRTRCDQFADALTDAIARLPNHEWRASPEHLHTTGQYSSFLQTLGADFDAINQKLAQHAETRRRLQVCQQALREIGDEVEEMKDEMHAQNQTLAERDGKIRDLEDRLASYTIIDDETTVDGGRDVEGRILDVNEDWNFVTIDLGKGKVEQGRHMLVARNGKLIARLLVSRVLGRISIAEIMPEARTGSVRVGDRVIAPLTEKTVAANVR